VIQKKLIPLAAACLFVVSAAQAAPELIAVGSLDGHSGDLATQTAAPLENGVAGNLLGGMGSGLTYAGCDTFLAVPDRGPNAVSYDSATDDTASYINRFQTLRMRLTPSAGGAALPYSVTPTLTATTLLSAILPLVYGDGVGLGVGSGAPALNNLVSHYFTGRSDNFAPSMLSIYPLDARFDPESIRVSNDGNSVFISDEYGPYIHRFDRRDGKRLWSYRLPDSFAVKYLSPVGADEISGNTSGRVANKGMEGLAITPDGHTLYGAMQSPLIQDGGTDAPYTRIVKLDLIAGATKQYAYALTNIGTATKPKYPTISEIVAINDHEFLVDERDGKGLGDNSTAVYKRLYKIDLSKATDVSDLSGAASLATTAVAKTPFLDVVAELQAHGYSAKDIPAKLEGLSFGPDLSVGGVQKHTLWLANDNDFIGTVTDSNHPNGIDTPNKFFVFAVDAADLPDFEPQQLAKNACR